MQVRGKVNTVTLDQCTKTGLVFQDLLASCEVVNCSGVQLQATGTVHTLAIDKSDGVQVRSLACSQAGQVPAWRLRLPCCRSTCRRPRRGRR